METMPAWWECDDDGGYQGPWWCTVLNILFSTCAYEEDGGRTVPHSVVRAAWMEVDAAIAACDVKGDSF